MQRRPENRPGVSQRAHPRGRLRYALFALAYMGLLYYVSSLPQDQLGGGFWTEIPDTVLHALAYAGLGFLDYQALRRTFGLPTKTACWLGWMIAAVYGVTDEVHQQFVPGRDASLKDLMADWIGAGAVLWVIGSGVAARLLEIAGFREKGG